MDEVDVPAGYVLMRQGDVGREMFVIASGRVVVEQDGKQVNELGPGGVLGEMALISEAPRSATVRVVEPARLFVAGHREFHSLMDSNPTIRTRSKAEPSPESRRSRSPRRAGETGASPLSA